MTGIIDWLAWLLVLIASAGILISRNWRVNLVLLAVQYLGVFWPLQNHWNLLQAASFLIAGWMSCTILALAHLGQEATEQVGSSWPQGKWFRFTVISIVFLVALVGTVNLNTWLSLSLPTTWSGLLLVGTGILLLGLSLHPLRIIVGLLMTLAGFEIIYSSLEKSVLVIGLLIVIHLGLALVGSYFIEQTGKKEPA